MNKRGNIWLPESLIPSPPSQPPGQKGHRHCPHFRIGCCRHCQPHLSGGKSGDGWFSYPQLWPYPGPRKDEIFDEVMVGAMRAPKTFTEKMSSKSTPTVVSQWQWNPAAGSSSRGSDGWAEANLPNGPSPMAEWTWPRLAIMDIIRAQDRQGHEHCCQTARRLPSKTWLTIPARKSSTPGPSRGQYRLSWVWWWEEMTTALLREKRPGISKPAGEPARAMARRGKSYERASPPPWYWPVPNAGKSSLSTTSHEKTRPSWQISPEPPEMSSKNMSISRVPSSSLTQPSETTILLKKIGVNRPARPHGSWPGSCWFSTHLKTDRTGPRPGPFWHDP